MTPFALDLSNPYHRICYSGWYNIVTKNIDERGRDISKWEPFVPFEHQKRLLNKRINQGCRRLLVPKARRMGFSTAINLDQLDCCLHNTNWHSKIVDQSQADAADKLVNRVHRAWKNLEKRFDINLKTTGENQKEIKFSNGSMFTADTSGRGGSAVQYLHVSELGPIDFEDAKRADEIIDGAFNAADGGIIVVESTAKGPIGHFKRLVDNALELSEDERTVNDWEVMFFAWHDDPRHILKGKFSRISKKTSDYLDFVADQVGKTLTDEQKLWYQVKSEEAANVKYEYPSLLSECWEQPIKGAIFAKDISEARADGRVGKFPYVREIPVYTIWDLGAPKNTRCICFQIIQGEIRIIDAIMGGYDEISRVDGPREPSDWSTELRKRGYKFAAHILPHDGNIKQYGGSSFKMDLEKQGLYNVRFMSKRGRDEWQRIRPTWQNFNRFVFNIGSPGVDVLMKHLESYHTKKEHDGITEKEVPHHDWSSHYADAFSAIIEAMEMGYTGDNNLYAPQQRKLRKPKPYTWSAYS